MDLKWFGGDRERYLLTYAVKPEAFAKALANGERIHKDMRKTLTVPYVVNKETGELSKHPPLTQDLFNKDHLAGLPLPMHGMSPFVSDSEVIFAVVDIDEYDENDPEATAKKACDFAFNYRDCKLMVEKTFSGGAHLWIIWEKPVPAEYAMEVADKVYFAYFGDDAPAPNTPGGGERFPKQEKRSETGNSVHLPYAGGDKALCYFMHTMAKSRFKLDDVDEVISRYLNPAPEDAARIAEAVAKRKEPPAEPQPTPEELSYVAFGGDVWDPEADAKLHTREMFERTFTLLRKFWPGAKSGERHNACNALLCALRDYYFEPGEAVAIVKEMARATGDRENRITDAENQWEKEKTTGLTRLLQILEPEPITAEWKATRKIILDHFRQYEFAYKRQYCLVKGEGYREPTLELAEKIMAKRKTHYANARNQICSIENAALRPIETAPELLSILDRLSPWITDKGRPANAVYADVMAVRYPRTHLQTINRLVTSPIVQADGSILQENGYHAPIKTLVDIADGDMIDVPEVVTIEMAQAALKRCGDLFCETDYVHESGLSVALAGMMMGVGSDSVDFSPSFIAAASGPGAGKGNHSYIWSRCKQPLATPYLTWSPDDPAENHKTLVGALVDGSGMIIFDNAVVIPAHPTWLALHTEGWLALRILGSTGNVMCSTKAFKIVTLNGLMGLLANLDAADIIRRSLFMEIDPPPDPEDHPYSFDPRKRFDANRKDYVTAIATVLRWAWSTDLREVDVAAHGSFSSFADRIRRPLVALGYPDPLLATLEMKRKGQARDPAKQAFFFKWLQMFGDYTLTAREVYDKVFDYASTTPAKRDFVDAIQALAKKDIGREIRGTQDLGYLLRKLDRQYYGREFRFVVGFDAHHKTNTYSLQVWNGSEQGLRDLNTYGAKGLL
ncbi:MAG: hypothetical protein U1E46_09625 [Hyphomicrobiales bacterium]